MVTLRFKDELKDLLTDTGTRVISDNNLPRLVRQLVVHINVSKHFLYSLSGNYWYLLQIRPSFCFSHFIFVMVLVPGMVISLANIRRGLSVSGGMARGID